MAGDATIAIELTNTGYPQDTGVEDFARPQRLNGPRVIREVVLGSTFEVVTEAFLGVRGREPFRVFSLRDPARVVIDVSHTDV